MIANPAWIKTTAPEPATAEPRFTHAAAMAVASVLRLGLCQFTERVTIAGSLRRQKPDVGDIELLYIPHFSEQPDGLFDTRMVNEVDEFLAELIIQGILAKRKNTLGRETWGERNKLAVHLASGIPIDFFAANAANWYNLLVCRTGSAGTNTRIASAALWRGLRWHPYSAGFTDAKGHLRAVKSEREVFEIAGLPYLEPSKR